MNPMPSPSNSSSSSVRSPIPLISRKQADVDSQLQEAAFTGPHKVPYRPGREFDFEADSDEAQLDIDLVMPPHRPRNQPENHRSSMRLRTDAEIMRTKVVSLVSLLTDRKLV